MWRRNAEFMQQSLVFCEHATHVLVHFNGIFSVWPFPPCICLLSHIKVTYMVNTKLGFMDWFLYYLILSNLYKTTALGTFQKWSSYETPLQNRLKQITFCHCTNFRLHEDVCSARSCTQKSCTHVVVVYWSKNISKNAPSPGCIQNADKNQPSMSYVGHRYI